MGSNRTGKGQTALVTGASMGIGVDLAECFARDGYDLILTARSEEALKQVAARLSGAFEGSDRATQLGMIDLNDRALAELTHIYWPRMLANKRGGVLNVASTASFQPGPLMAIYYASKAFVLSFSE